MTYRARGHLAGGLADGLVPLLDAAQARAEARPTVLALLVVDPVLEQVLVGHRVQGLEFHELRPGLEQEEALVRWEVDDALAAVETCVRSVGRDLLQSHERKGVRPSVKAKCTLRHHDNDDNVHDALTVSVP